jgi:hypothetical protein
MYGLVLHNSSGAICHNVVFGPLADLVILPSTPDFLNLTNSGNKECELAVTVTAPGNQTMSASSNVTYLVRA